MVTRTARYAPSSSGDKVNVSNFKPSNVYSNSCLTISFCEASSSAQITVLIGSLDLVKAGQLTLKAQGKEWFFAQIAEGRDPSGISAAEVDKAIGATVGYCKKHIKQWHAEAAAQTAVNQ